MEHRNVTRFREAHEARSSGDLGPFADLLAEDVEWWDTGAPEPLRGRSKALARLSQLAEHNTSVELHDLFGNDEHIVALIHASARRGDDHLDYSTAEVYHLSADGLITKRQAFAHDTREISAFFS